MSEIHQEHDEEEISNKTSASIIDTYMYCSDIGAWKCNKHTDRRPTEQPNDRPTDGHEGSYVSCRPSKNIVNTCVISVEHDVEGEGEGDDE